MQLKQAAWSPTLIGLCSARADSTVRQHSRQVSASGHTEMRALKMQELENANMEYVSKNVDFDNDKNIYISKT